jgi:hypothetical protein
MSIKGFFKKEREEIETEKREKQSKAKERREQGDMMCLRVRNYYFFYDVARGGPKKK